MPMLDKAIGISTVLQESRSGAISQLTKMAKAFGLNLTEILMERENLVLQISEAKEVAGQDVDDDELAIVKATAQNIASAASLSGIRAINQAVERFLAGIASKIAL